MAKLIVLHSFRRGVGRSTIAANVGALLARAGQRVCVVDANIRSPSLHVLFGIPETTLTNTLNTYLWGQCALPQAVAAVMPDDRELGGRLFLLPATCEPHELARILNKRASLEALNAGLVELIEHFALDVLLLDGDAGLSPETLAFMTIADIVLLLMHCDQQDYQGTGILVDVARKIDVPRLLILVNEVPTAFDLTAIRRQISAAYRCEVAVAVPHSAEMMTLDSQGLFVLRYPAHPLTALYRELVDKLMV